MKIGFDATVLGPQTCFTGGGEYAANLLRALAAQDGGDTYVLYGWPGSQRPSDIPPSMEWRAAPLKLGKLSALVNHLFVLPLLTRRDGIEVLHAPTVHTRASMPPVPATGCPLAVTLHDLIPLTYYESNGQGLPAKMRMFYKWNLRRAMKSDRIITVSETSKSEIQREFGADRDRVVAIHNGVAVPPERADDGETLARLGVRRNFVLYVGSWEPRKNLRRLLDAFDRAVAGGLDMDLVLVVERSSGHAAGMMEYARSLACWGRLQFLHSLETDTLWTLYRKAAALAYPSLYEGFGLPPVQAMACGTPVVAAPNGSLREVLGEAALYIDPLDVRSIADGLLAVANDCALRQRLTEAGLSQAACYSWEEAARKTTDVYHEIAGVAK